MVTFLDNVHKNKYYGFFKGLYKRNKTVIIISTLIFFISVLLGYILSGPLDPVMAQAISGLKGKFSKTGISTASIFLNNIQSALITYVGGLVGFITFFLLFSNGLIIGYLAAKIPFKVFLILVAPHGIFEIPALILSGAAGFRLTSMVINMITSLLNRKPISEHYWQFKDSLALFAISAVLFLIAAIIEANVTFALIGYAKSLI
ncbi:MAG TPA: stage II sporulation protein M [Methanobacterium sp.]|nr:stage II sporulation protein M [Methanobacterium sp.]